MADTTSYPIPRERSGPGSSTGGGSTALGGAGAGSQIPVVRLWPVLAQARVGTLRTTVVSPRFRGPALIDFAWFSLFGQENAFTPSLSILWSTDNTGEQTNSANTALPTGTPIFEQLSNQAPTQTVFGGPGLAPLEGTSVREPQMLPLRYPIIAPEFFLKWTVAINNAAEDVTWSGMIRILEGIAEADLLGFL